MVGKFIFFLWLVCCPWLWNVVKVPISVKIQPIWNFSEVEITQINFYRDAYKDSYFGQLLGKMSLNKLDVIWSHVTDRFFTYLDFNFYFFGNHPRERVGVVEIPRLFFWSLPILILGMIKMSKMGMMVRWFTIFLIVNLSISISGLTGNLVEILFLPLMAYVLMMGTTYVLEKT